MNYILFALLGFILGAIAVYFFNKKRIDALLQNLAGLDKEKTVVIATLESENKNLLEKLQSHKDEIEALQKRLTTEFENIANRILKERANEFSLSNQRSIGEMLNPLKEKISAFEKKVEDTYNSETREKAVLRRELEQIIKINQQMSDDAQRLTLALKGDSKTQGDWGEWQLELLLEKSGLQKDVHFSQQQSLRNDEGLNLRPDYIINLPDNKQYVIDSKVSLTAYERYFNEENEKLKPRFLKEHINSLLNHINDLGTKNYQNLYGINTPDFVFMFIALEPALTIALQNEPTLFEKAFQKNIVLVSTTTLLASLRTVSFIWKQENQKNNVLEIARLSGLLYDKFVGFVEDMERIKFNLERATNSYDEAYRKMNTGLGNMTRTAERIRELGAKATKKIPRTLIDNTIENI